MWSGRIRAISERIPGPFDHLIGVDDPETIFAALKAGILQPDYWQPVAEVFSPLILHIVSELIIDVISGAPTEPTKLVILFSNLLRTFPSIEPLVHYYFTYRPAHTGDIRDCEYLRALFRIVSVLGNSFDILLSPFLEILETEDVPEETGFFLASLVAIIHGMTESEAADLLNSKCSPERQSQLMIEEAIFCSRKLVFEDYGPMSFDKRYATFVEGVPFLRSLNTDSSASTHVPTSPYAKSLALAMLTKKPVLVVGPSGSGKTTLIEELAALAGTEIVSLHLGSAVDAKSLLGGYICGEVPGEFRWLDGPLTSAVRANEKWIVLEQIEEASSEVSALIAPLLSERKLFIPGRSETIKAGYNTKIFATSLKSLESSLWTKICVDFMELDDLRATILKVFPKSDLFLDRVLESWKVCDLTYHELFRCCRRLSKFDYSSGAVSNETYIVLFRVVVDTFTSSFSSFEKRLQCAKEIAECWSLSGDDAEAYLMNDKPAIVHNPFRIGSVELEQIGDASPPNDFAYTFTALHHMESVARSLSMNEPVLLIGETGTGKTTLVQYMARAIGAKLEVINMHHQSDTLDILGGFKPVDLQKLLEPIRARFHTAFERSVSTRNEKNAKFLNDTETFFGTKRWEEFLKNIVKFAQAVLKKGGISESLLNEWASLKHSCLGFLSRTDFLKRDFAFGFDEGPLTTAYRTGSWILLDEVNLAPPETLLALAPIMDGQLVLPNGEFVEKHPNFRLVCCMNPATDVGKVNLPETLRHKFTSIFTDETSSQSDIELILTQRGVNSKFHSTIYQFYYTARALSKTILTDGAGRRILYSLRALTRAILYMNKAETLYGAHKACYDALSLAFVSPLSPESGEKLQMILNEMISPKPLSKKHESNLSDMIEVEGFYLPKGPLPIKKRPDFIRTATTNKHLKLLAQAIFLKDSPVLLQGPTSCGKTSMVEYLADITGHAFVRINNHEHTDMSEYIGGYSTSETGKFEFVYGALVRAVKEGAWVVLDELNLAPSDVLEALNRLLDQNNELNITETKEVIRPGSTFMLFATQNPPGAYGGRKQLSRAFRGRFVEIHVDEIPAKELNEILMQRCGTAKPFANAMVSTFMELRRMRQFSQVFAGKHAFLTVRDLLRWANRNPDTWQLVADEGYALLGERLRFKEERDLMEDVIAKKCKHKINHELEIPEGCEGLDIVWTSGMRRSVALLLRCVANKEPALLVGETGTGKTTAVQVIAHLLGRKLRILNCHQHTETADFIGAMRPSRSDSGKLFEWIDGSLVEAMKEGDIFLMDEISLAQDSALERLNSVLEPSRTLAIAEKPECDIVKAHDNFVFIATMNPGGDYGKRELSPSLRNRFTEIWVPSIDSDTDLLEILAANSTQQATRDNGQMFLDFVRCYTSLNKVLRNISLRDVLQWIRFVDRRVSQGFGFEESYCHGAFMVFIDCVPPNLRTRLIEFLQEQTATPVREFDHEVKREGGKMSIGDFELPLGPLFDATSPPNFIFDAPTTSQNLLRVGRALQMPLPVLIEGPPGVGKTSLVASLGQALGFRVVRINLSEHTEMLDLVGSELPVEGGGSGKFSWRDGAFLTALKNGDWVILDELNLASQSVLEGLNACLDHRATLYVPELDQEFKCHPLFRIFGCQNPAGAGHGRKSLPRSFLNRFTKVYVDELTPEDFEFIVSNCYTDIPLDLRRQMNSFIAELNELHLDFEFNLRDVFRLCEMLKAGISIRSASLILFVYRLRSNVHREKVLNLCFRNFGQFDPNPSPFLLSSKTVRIGDMVIDRSSGVCTPMDACIHPSLMKPLEAILACALMKWPGLVIGTAATGKSSLIRLASHIMGRKLVEFSMNASVDTTELLGGFEQMDNHRCFEQLKRKINVNDARAVQALESISTPEELCSFVNENLALFSESTISEANELLRRKADPGRFEWVDGLLLQAMRYGWWIVIDNANLCPPAVLDRLNPLCEPGGFLSLNERGIVGDDIETVVPHENFRLFMTVNPKYGEISRAMRNRSIEIYMPNYAEREMGTGLLDECRALANDAGEVFFSLMTKSSHQDLLHLSAWNLMSFATFKEQTAIAQLGLDAVHFNIVSCQLTKTQSAMTRSNSSFVSLKTDYPIASSFRFIPMTTTNFLSVLYDAQYFISKGVNSAAIRFFAGQSRACDFDIRMIMSEKWPQVCECMRKLQSSDLLQFTEDLPLDPVLWPKSQESFAFLAHWLLITLNIEACDYGDVESVDAQLKLSSLIPIFFSDLIDKIKFSIQTNDVNAHVLMLLRIIDKFSRKEKSALPLFRFLRSILKKAKLDVNLDEIMQLLCPGNSLESAKQRHALGEPFSFKTEESYKLWTGINKYWMDLFEKSNVSFYQQQHQIITMLSSIVQSQTVCESVGTVFEKLKQLDVVKETSVSYLDRVETEYSVIEEMRVVNLTTPYPSEMLQNLSLRCFILSILNAVNAGSDIVSPRPFSIPLDIIALVDSYKHTHNFCDLSLALFELIHHIDKEVTVGPTYDTIQAVVKRKGTLVESSHDERLKDDLYALLTQVPSCDRDSVVKFMANFCNVEAEKLGSTKVDPQTFQDSFFRFAKDKWDRISALSEIDDAYYHMIVYQLSSQICKELTQERDIVNEIMVSRNGNENSVISRSYSVESESVNQVALKSLKKSKYRGGFEEFQKLRSIVSRITVAENEAAAKSLDESATTLLLDFPLYRDVTVPLVTAMRQLAMGITYREPSVKPVIPFPFSAEDLVTSVFSCEKPFWPITFSLIGRTELIQPPLEFELPRQDCQYQTETEEEKAARQIEELFSKTKKDELNVLAANFVDSMLSPDSLDADKLMRMLLKQLDKLEFANISMEADSTYLPLLLYSLWRRHHISRIQGQKVINIYEKSSTEDIGELLTIVRRLLELIDGLWERYPGHDLLRRMSKAAEVILSQEVTAPLNAFLDSLEFLMGMVREWQHRERDFGEILVPIVRLANKFLKMRLQSWKYIFESRRKVLQQNTGRNFYMLLAELSECTEVDKIPPFFNAIHNYLEMSPIGLLESNLKMVEALALYSRRISGDLIFCLLMNLVCRYRRYLPIIEAHIKTELVPLEKTMREYIDLQKWDSDSDKKHFIKIDNVKRQLNKYCQQHLAIISPVVKVMQEQFQSAICQDMTVRFAGDSEIDKKCSEILDEEVPIENRELEARRYAAETLEVSDGDNQKRRDIAQLLMLYGHKPLYGSQFTRHNDLFGEVLILLEQIRNTWGEAHNDVKEIIRTILGLSENLTVMLIDQRVELSVEPVIYRDDIRFIFNQAVAVLTAFAELDGDSKISEAVRQIASLGNLKDIPKQDLISHLQNLPSLFKDNYVHYSEAMYIHKILELLERTENSKPQKQEANADLARHHLSTLRFTCAAMKIWCKVIKEGFGKHNEEEDNEPQQCEGTDGVGLGEGKGDEDITNEIEDEAQLEGDNVNTNEDQQNAEDVEREDGFEMENEFEGAADVSAHEEEDQMDDEMGDAEDADAIDSREAEDTSKEADREAELDTKNKEEQMDGTEDSNNEIDDEPEQKPDQIELDQEEDQFESDAGEWSDNREEIEMNVDEENMIENNPDAPEEEEQVDEQVVEEIPEDIEDIKDEMLGLAAPDKTNPEGEEDECEDEEVQGEGKGDAAGEGSEGEGAEEDQGEKTEEEEKNETNQQLQDIEKELEIVQKKILKDRKLQEGGEGGERDDNADQGVILPADEAEDRQDDQEAQEDAEQEERGEKEGNIQEFPPTEPAPKLEDGGLTHIEFNVIDSTQGQIEMREVPIAKGSITPENRAHWDELVGKTREGASDLCEQLRLVLEANVAAKMRGDFRTGKRLNMRKIIPFIASGFRKDKIWMRRIQPDQRNFQILLAIDNSESMQENAGGLALQSVCLITQALTLLGIGELGVAKFGERTEIVHPFGEQWNDDAGASLVDSFDFQDKKTIVHDLIGSSLSYLDTCRKNGSVQLLFIISDGFFSDKEKVKQLAIQAQLRNLLVVFVIMADSNTQYSILTTRAFKPGTMEPVMYLDDFPFSFYLIIQDPQALPVKLGDALRQWFDLANSQ